MPGVPAVPAVPAPRTSRPSPNLSSSRYQPTAPPPTATNARWEVLPCSMVSQRGGHAVSAAGDTLYVIGGFDGVQAMPSCELFEPRVSAVGCVAATCRERGGRRAQRAAGRTTGGCCSGAAGQRLPAGSQRPLRVSARTCAALLRPFSCAIACVDATLLPLASQTCSLPSSPHFALPPSAPSADQHVACDRRHGGFAGLRLQRHPGQHRVCSGRAAERHAGGWVGGAEHRVAGGW